MDSEEGEDDRLRMAALKNAEIVRIARQRADRELLTAKEALERKTEELQQQREWFEVTLASIGDAVITTDPSGRIKSLNPVAESMTGWSAEEAKGQPVETVFRIINEDTRLPADNPIQTALRSGKIVSLANHTALIRKDGREVAVEDSAAPIRDTRGDICGAVMVFHDISRRRQAERALVEVDRRNVRSHDFGNTLADAFLARSRSEGVCPSRAPWGRW